MGVTAFLWLGCLKSKLGSKTVSLKYTALGETKSHVFFLIINGAEIPSCLNTSVTTLSIAVAVDGAAKAGPRDWRRVRCSVHHFSLENKENCHFGAATAELICLFRCWRVLELCKTAGGIESRC